MAAGDSFTPQLTGSCSSPGTGGDRRRARSDSPPRPHSEYVRRARPVPAERVNPAGVPRVRGNRWPGPEGPGRAPTRAAGVPGRPGPRPATAARPRRPGGSLPPEYRLRAQRREAGTSSGRRAPSSAARSPGPLPREAGTSPGSRGLILGAGPKPAPGPRRPRAPEAGPATRPEGPGLHRVAEGRPPTGPGIRAAEHRPRQPGPPGAVLGPETGAPAGDRSPAPAVRGPCSERLGLHRVAGGDSRRGPQPAPDPWRPGPRSPGPPEPAPEAWAREPAPARQHRPRARPATAAALAGPAPGGRDFIGPPKAALGAGAQPGPAGRAPGGPAPVAPAPVARGTRRAPAPGPAPAGAPGRPAPRAPGPRPAPAHPP